METTIKIILLSVVVIVLNACATQSKTIAAIALDKEQGDTILPKSLPMPKGKVCFVYTTSYGNELPIGCDLKKKSYADFTSSYPGKGLLGGRFFSGEADTTITSNILVQSAIYEVARRLPPGMEFAILNKDELTDKAGEFQVTQLIEKYQPDVIVTLTDLIFFINGDVNASGITQTRVEGDAYMIGADMQYSGNIFIDYQAQWSIIRVKDNNRQIEQKGQIRSVYGKDYDFPRELFLCAKQAGADFASLLICGKQ